MKQYYLQHYCKQPCIVTLNVYSYRYFISNIVKFRQFDEHPLKVVRIIKYWSKARENYLHICETQVSTEGVARRRSVEKVF